MNLYYLRYFVTLAQDCNYTKAAERLNITQPNLSYAIRMLEKELGVPLFEKKGRGTALTKHGTQFLEDTKNVLLLLDASIEKMMLAKEGKECIEIGFPRILGIRFVPERLRGFLDTAPGAGVTFRFHEGISRELLKLLETRECDLIFSTYRANEKEFAFAPVVEKQLYVIVPQEHPLAAKEEISLEETLAYPQIVFHPHSGIRSLVDSLFEELGQYPQIVMEIMEDQVIAGFVAERFGIAIVEDMQILETLPVKKLKLKAPGNRQIFYMAWRKHGRYTPVFHEFLTYMKAHTEMLP